MLTRARSLARSSLRRVATAPLTVVGLRLRNEILERALEFLYRRNLFWFHQAALFRSDRLVANASR